MSIFKILDTIQKQNQPKNPYELYYYISQNPQSVYQTNKKGFNCLTLTLSTYSKEVVQILLDIIQILILSNKIKSDVFSVLDKNGNNVYSTVLKIKNLKQRHERLEILIKMDIPIDIRDTHKDTPLHIACRYNDYNSANLLTKNKFTRKINTIGNHDATPIFHTIINKNVELFKLLIDCGAILKGTVEDKYIDYTYLIQSQNNEKLTKVYNQFLKKENKRQKQKLIREAKKKDIRNKYKKLCQDLNKTKEQELIKFAESININVKDNQDPRKIKSKQELCKLISQRVVMKMYFPHFPFREVYT
jgi:ankyrin repeat protein